MQHDSVTPYSQPDQSKRQQVEDMFDNIAVRYDLLNRLMTMGIDVGWRRKAIKLLAPYQPETVVDIATGTGDFALEAARLNPQKIIGIDISNQMLAVGRKKIAKRGLSDFIEMRQGDSLALELQTDSVDAITVGFGVRNFQDLRRGLGEMLRVLRPGGAAVILEPSYPTQFPLKQLFSFYFSYVTPLMGRMVSGDNSAYGYLTDSVRAFPNGTDFTQICREVGYAKAQYRPLTFGTCSLYLLEK